MPNIVKRHDSPVPFSDHLIKKRTDLKPRNHAESQKVNFESDELELLSVGSYTSDVSTEHDNDVTMLSEQAWSSAQQRTYGDKRRLASGDTIPDPLTDTLTSTLPQSTRDNSKYTVEWVMTAHSENADLTVELPRDDPQIFDLSSPDVLQNDVFRFKQKRQTRTLTISHSPPLHSVTDDSDELVHVRATAYNSAVYDKTLSNQTTPQKRLASNHAKVDLSSVKEATSGSNLHVPESHVARSDEILVSSMADAISPSIVVKHRQPRAVAVPMRRKQPTMADVPYFCARHVPRTYKHLEDIPIDILSLIRNKRHPELNSH